MIALKYKSWDDITIPIYQEIIEIAKSNNDGEADAYDEREVDILAVLCDSDRESLGNIYIGDYAKLAQESQFLRKLPFYTPSKTITLRGVEYKVVVDVSKFTLAQYTEYNALRTDANGNMAGILATMLIPTTAKHYADGYDVADVVEAIKAELPYYKGCGILHFFQVAQGFSLANSLRLEAKAKRKMARMTQSSEERERLKKQAAQLRKASISLGRCLLSRL